MLGSTCEASGIDYRLNELLMSMTEPVQKAAKQGSSAATEVTGWGNFERVRRELMLARRRLVFLAVLVNSGAPNEAANEYHGVFRHGMDKANRNRSPSRRHHSQTSTKATEPRRA